MRSMAVPVGGRTALYREWGAIRRGWRPAAALQERLQPRAHSGRDRGTRKLAAEAAPARARASARVRRLDRFQRVLHQRGHRSEEHTSELQSLMRISYAAFCLQNNNTLITHNQLTNK